MRRFRFSNFLKENTNCKRCRKLSLDVNQPSIIKAVQSNSYERVVVPLGDPRMWSSTCELCDILRKLARYEEGQPLEGRTFYLVPGVPFLFGGREHYSKTNKAPPICWTVLITLPQGYSAGHLPAAEIEFKSLVDFHIGYTDMWLCPFHRSDGNPGASVWALDSSANLEWLDECASSHSRCWSDAEHAREYLSHKGVPIGVVDCSAKLIISLPSHEQYLTLSYCWGTPSPDQEDIPDGQLPAKLSKVIGDAMKATLALGFNYLWVDRYCIYQKDPEDKEMQIGRMDAIYASSFATIVAAAGEDSTFGLPGISSRPLSLMIKKGNSVWVMTPPSQAAVEGSTWNTRGWTYQEAVLSLRLIFFLPEQIYFECRQSCLAESVSFPDMTKGIAPLHQAPLFSMYMNKTSELDRRDGGPYGHIEKYSRRHLTKPDDILKGILGVFNDFSSQERGFYFISGIPTISKSVISDRPTLKTQAQHFASSLCWFKIGPSRQREGFPTWSWTGWYLPVSRSFGAKAGHKGGEFLDIVIEVDGPTVHSQQSWTPLDMYLKHQQTEPGCSSVVRRIRVESLFIPEVHLQCSMRGTCVGVWKASIYTGPHGTLEGTFYPNEGKEERRARKPGCDALDGNVFPGLVLGVFFDDDQDYIDFDVLVFEEDSNGNAERVGLVDFNSKGSSGVRAWLIETLKRKSIILL